jgi:hypothetical protein
MVFIGTDYTTTKQGSIAKFVCCEACSHEYVYILSRKSVGKALSVLGLHDGEAATRSERNAESALRERLEKGCDPVPCPQCGWYQPPMVVRVRQLRLRWMKDAAFVLAGLWVVVGFFLLYGRMKIVASGEGLLAYFGVVVLACFAWAAVYAIRMALNANYNPNEEAVEKRLEIGKKRATSKAEFLKDEVLTVFQKRDEE